MLEYWRTYGGWRAFATSPFLWFAVAISAACFNLWYQPIWVDIPVAVLPGMLGFTLAGYAILLTFGDENFRKFIQGPTPTDPVSPFLELSATFCHFVVVQILGLILALIIKSKPMEGIERVFQIAISFKFRHELGLFSHFFVFTIFIYAILCGLAAVIRVFNVSRHYDRFNSSTEIPPSKEGGVSNENKEHK